MPPKAKAHQAEPVVEAAPPPQEPVCEPEPLGLPEQLSLYYEKLKENVDAAASYLSEVLGLPEYQTDARSAIKLDFSTGVLELAKDLKFGPQRTASLFSIAEAVFEATLLGASFADTEATFKSLLLQQTSPKPGSDSPLFSPDQVAQVAGFFARTFFQHWRLYALVFSSDQEVTECEANLLVETARVQAFDIAQSEEEWYAAQEAAAAEKAAREAAEAEAQAAAEAAAAAEEARRAAEEAEARRREELERKPATLEEAIEKMVAIRLEAEKVILADEYRGKEEVLLKRISDLESIRTPPGTAAGRKK